MGYFLIPHSLWPTPFGGWVLLDCGLFLLQPILLLFSTVFAFPIAPFYHSCCDVIRPKPARLLWVCCLFFSQWLSMVIGLFVMLLAGSCVPFPLGHPWPIYFPWASSALSNFVFPWAFTNSFGLPWPNYFILHLLGLWIFHQPLTLFTCITLGLSWPILTFLHHVLPMGLLLLSFQASLARLLPQGPFIYFISLWSIISTA